MMEDFSEEEQVPTRRVKPKRSKQSAKKSPRKKQDDIEPDDDPGVDSGPEEVFDKSAYLNQPLNKKEGERIHGFGQDWEISRKGFRIDAVEMVKSLAGSMTEYVQEREDSKELDELDKVMKEILDIDQAFRIHQESLVDVHQRVKKGEQIKDIIAVYEAGVKERKAKYGSQTTRRKYAKDDDYVGFQQAIFEIKKPGEAMPPVSEFIPKEEGDESDDDDDIQVGGVTQDYKCPLSLTPLVNPMSSQVCRHSFSGEAIREYLKKGPSRCPAAGCNRMLSMNDLKEDKQLARKVKEATRRQQMRNQRDTDDDEIVE